MLASPETIRGETSSGGLAPATQMARRSGVVTLSNFILGVGGEGSQTFIRSWSFHEDFRDL